VRQAYKSKAKTGVPAIPVAAQGLLEGGHEGKGELYDYKTGKRSYNIFGIKADPERGLVGDNGWVRSWTHEQRGDKKELELHYFRAYKSLEACFIDHAEVLKLPRYKKAFDYPNDPEKFITEVWKGGYATDENYLRKIIPIIRTLNKIPVWLLKL
jgi:flagellum-specific peptidoglycan hydrolase FlgJ